MPDFTRGLLAALGGVDILVAIPTYHNAATIAGVAAAAARALARDFPGRRGLVLNVDGDPQDSTAFVFNSTLFPEGVMNATTLYNAPPGRGNALHLAAEAVEITGAQLCVVLDPALEEPDDTWPLLLAAPLLDGSADLATPVYAYRAFDDLPARLLAQPLVAPAIVAGDWAAPAATDRAFSAALAGSLRQNLPAEPSVQGAGGDLWLSYQALLQGARVVQVGTLARDRLVRDPAVPLGQDFAQLVATAFGLVLRETGVPCAEPPRLTLAAPARVLEPVDTTQPALIARFKRGAVTAAQLWETVLAPARFEQVRTIAAGQYKGEAAAAFYFPVELWVGIVYDWLRAYQDGTVPRAALLDGLGPLFNGFTASFVATARSDPGGEATQLTLLGQVFRAMAPAE